MKQSGVEWMRLQVQSVIEERSRAAQSGVKTTPVVSTDGTTTGAQRERRLPPMPSWYGSRDRATLESLAAKNALTSRGGASRRRG